MCLVLPLRLSLCSKAHRTLLLYLFLMECYSEFLPRPEICDVSGLHSFERCLPRHYYPLPKVLNWVSLPGRVLCCFTPDSLSASCLSISNTFVKFACHQQRNRPPQNTGHFGCPKSRSMGGVSGPLYAMWFAGNSKGIAGLGDGNRPQNQLASRRCARPTRAKRGGRGARPTRWKPARQPVHRSIDSLIGGLYDRYCEWWIKEMFSYLHIAVA